MRDLASVVTIDRVWELPGKDRVQGATFSELDFDVMISKDIQPGTLVAFIQEGACLPVCENWEWLRKRCYRDNLNGKEGFLIKPQKFKEIKSWGVAVPLNELGLKEPVYSKLKAGDDITDLLGIWKFEPVEDVSPTDTKPLKKWPGWVKFCYKYKALRWLGQIWVKLHQNKVTPFPTNLISKTDETALQNMKGILERNLDTPVYITPKMEGQSFTIIPTFKYGKIHSTYPCSRNIPYPKQDESILWKMMIKYDVLNKMKELWNKHGIAVIVQGEQVGPTIQQNIYDFEDNKWYVFTMKDYHTKKQLSYDQMKGISEMLGLPIVQNICQVPEMKQIFTTTAEAIDFAERVVFTPYNGSDEIVTTIKDKLDKYLWKEYLQHEGIVVRSINYDKDNGHGFSFKIKNSDYHEKGLGYIHDKCVELKKKMTKEK